MSIARNDTLTGLLLPDQFRDALESTVRDADTVTLGLLDLDHFKELNDTYGHGAGDELLGELGRRLCHFAEEHRGIAGRIGGDEFAVALPGVNLEAAFLQFERFRTGVEAAGRELVPSAPGYVASLSIGVASFPRDVRTAGELLSRADQALWAAKEAGRNQVALPAAEEMIMKTCYYTTAQVGRLKRLAEQRKRKESVLLREALDDLLRKYDVK